MGRAKSRPWSFSATGFATWFYRDTAGNRKRLAKAAQAGLKEALVWWRDSQLPKHFKSGAGRIWGYARRTDRYLKEKGRLIARGASGRAAVAAKSIDHDLVLTGTLRDWMLNNRRPIKSSTGVDGKPRAVLGLAGPPYLFHVDRKTGGESQLAREILRLLKWEKRHMSKITGKKMIEKLKSSRDFIRKAV